MATTLRLLVVFVFLLGGTAGISNAAQPAGKKEYAFRGKVENVDLKAKKLTVNGENVEGWMKAMTMNYKVDKDEVLRSLKAGDEITAKVYDGDFETLYAVQKSPPSTSKR